ncbi:hypothetical protein COL922a_013121 [Colletotrichum nupharicola]|nr:hypothetical protein COL922a_013121 [Colletotrichum nupharicola]
MGTRPAKQKSAPRARALKMGTFSQGIERSWNAIKLSAAMVRNEHAVNTMLDGQCNVVGGVD